MGAAHAEGWENGGREGPRRGRCGGRVRGRGAGVSLEGDAAGLATCSAWRRPAQACGTWRRPPSRVAAVPRVFGPLVGAGERIRLRGGGGAATHGHGRGTHPACGGKIGRPGICHHG